MMSTELVHAPPALRGGGDATTLILDIKKCAERTPMNCEKDNKCGPYNLPKDKKICIPRIGEFRALTQGLYTEKDNVIKRFNAFISEKRTRETYEQALKVLRKKHGIARDDNKIHIGSIVDELEAAAFAHMNRVSLFDRASAGVMKMLANAFLVVFDKFPNMLIDRLKEILTTETEDRAWVSYFFHGTKNVGVYILHKVVKVAFLYGSADILVTSVLSVISTLVPGFGFVLTMFPPIKENLLYYLKILLTLCFYFVTKRLIKDVAEYDIDKDARRKYRRLERKLKEMENDLKGILNDDVKNGISGGSTVPKLSSSDTTLLFEMLRQFMLRAAETRGDSAQPAPKRASRRSSKRRLF